MTTQKPDKLTPSDPRVEHHFLTINSHKWHYLLASRPQPTATILLVHGWPDLSFGWRYQVPYLLNTLNLRVIVPDMLGYGRTDAPDPIAPYSHKSICDSLATLASHVLGDPEEKIILGGHDWGGAIVWRFALWHPHLVKAVFSVCTPYNPPRDGPYMSLEDMVATVLPNFAYQVQLAGREVEEGIQGRDRIRQFLRALYGGRGPNKEVGFSTAKGVVWEEIDKIGDGPLLSEEELEFYVDEYERHGMHGPLNWYRLTRVNWEEERELVGRGEEGERIKVPSLMVTASRDSALPPSMAGKMERYFENLVKREVDATHWALWERPGEVNGYIGEFLKGVLGGEQSRL